MSGEDDEITLIDPVALKRYVVVHDSEGAELGPKDIAFVANNKPKTAQYTFAAPSKNALLDIYQGSRKVFEQLAVTP